MVFVYYIVTNFKTPDLIIANAGIAINGAIGKLSDIEKEEYNAPQKVLEEQSAYKYLDSPPKTVTSKDHRPAYGDDGDYFSKSNKDDLIDKCYELMNEFDPKEFPNIYENN